MPRYATFRWRGKTIRRRQLTRAEKKQKAQRFKATMSARRSERAKAKVGARRAALARVPENRTHGASAAEPAAPDVMGAIQILTGAESWIAQARERGWLKQLDPGHRAVIAALGALLGHAPV